MMLGLCTSYIIKNVSIIDLFWCIGLFFQVFCYWIFSDRLWFHHLFLMLIFIWMFRLSFFFYWTRFRHGHIDHRYESIINQSSWGKHVTIVTQYLFQWFLQVILGLSYLPLLSSKSIHPIFFFVGITLLTISIIGESISDFQLYKFKKTSSGVFRKGLWSLSRHPNYLFHWLCWVAIFTCSVGTLGWYVSLIGVFGMWIIFRFITGPVLERLSLKRKGNEYRDYQQSVGMIIPKF